MPVKERHFCHLLNTRVDRLLLFSLIASILTCTAARAQSDPPPPPTAPNSYHDSFEQGYLFFDDGVGVLHVRQSGSTAEGDYAHGISGSDGGFYGRLLVQPWLQNNAGPGLASSMCPNGTNCGINGSQSGRCNPGATEGDNGFSCDGPFTEWGLPFGGYDGNFDTGIPIRNGALTSIDIYLDTAFAASARSSGGTTDYRFDWDSDLLDRQGSFLQDYIFNVATGQTSDVHCSAFIPAGGFYVIEASTNSQRNGANAHNPMPPNPPQACISQSGWYTFQHTFRPDHSGNLEVDMVILDSHHQVVASWTLHPTCMGTQASEGLCTAGQPLPFSAVGFNFLGWFPDQEINNLAIDNFYRVPNDHDRGGGKDANNDQMEFDDSKSDPASSQMQYQDPSQGINLQSVNGVSSIAYNNTCVSFAGSALVNQNPGYLYTFTACDLQALGTGIGTFTINITGPLGFLYQKSAALTSGFVSVTPQ